MKFALNFSKDEETGEFQISIGFNKPHDVIIEDKKIPLAAIYMRYGKDYKTTFVEAQSILNDLVDKGILKFRNLRASNIFIERALQLHVTKEEEKNGFAFRDGKL